jgi:hypothetical protein
VPGTAIASATIAGDTVSDAAIARDTVRGATTSGAAIPGDVELGAATTIVFIFTFRKNLFALYFVQIFISSQVVG